MKGFGIFKVCIICIICGVLIIVANFTVVGISFGQGLTDNMKQKGFDRFLGPEQNVNSGFSQNPLYGSSCPEWLISAGNKFNFPATNRQKAISYFTSFPKRLFSFYVGNIVNKTIDFKLNRTLARNDWDYKLNRMKIREGINFKIINVGP